MRKIRIALHMKAAIILSLILLSLASCSSTPLTHYRKESEITTKKLAKELGKIRTRGQLVDAEPRLRILFSELADVIIAADIYQKDHEISVDSIKKNSYNDELKHELERIYSINGCRAIVESCQAEAIEKLNRISSITDI